QEVEFLLEEAVDLFAELLIEIGHRPAAELEALGRILGRPAAPLHDAIHGNLGADNNFPHRSLSLFEFRTIGLLPSSPKKLTSDHTRPQYTVILSEDEIRIRQHKLGEVEGFAKKYKCTRLVYYEVYDHIHKTIDREKQLKGWRRSKKIAL